ncbi:MAG: hypothetical protein KDK72_09585 [Chlamydiia bacterium]|nr:hypothetical protein [Chlamydiia bacterium]
MGLLGRTDAFGYHTEQLWLKRTKNSCKANKRHFNSGEEKEVRSRGNLFKIAGYVPVIGTIIGIARIIQSIQMIKEENKSGFGPNRYYVEFAAGNISRGVIEATSLGCLLIIPDLILTVARLAIEKFDKA